MKCLFVSWVVVVTVAVGISWLWSLVTYSAGIVSRGSLVWRLALVRTDRLLLSMRNVGLLCLHRRVCSLWSLVWVWLELVILSVRK